MSELNQEDVATYVYSETSQEFVNHVYSEEEEEEEEITSSSYINGHGETVALVREESSVKFFKEIADNVITSTPAVNHEVHEEHEEYDNETDGSFLTHHDTAQSPNQTSGLRKRATLMQSFCGENEDEFETDTLENHLFPDMSFSESEVLYDPSQAQFRTRLSSEDAKWSKLHGVTYKNVMTSVSNDIDVTKTFNHPSRSDFRQRRRDWYLNRKSASMRPKGKKPAPSPIFAILISVFLKCIHKLRNIFRYSRIKVKFVTDYLFTLFRSSIWSVTRLYPLPLQAFHYFKEKVKLIYSAEDRSIERSKKVSCFTRSLKVLAAVLLLFLITVRYLGEPSDEQILSPASTGFENAEIIRIDEENLDIPAWYIYPQRVKISSLHPASSSLSGLSPVILFLRKDVGIDSSEMTTMYHTLVSLGYNIIVPTDDTLTQQEILATWKWIKGQTGATAYLWGYGIDAPILADTAKVLCDNLLPPNGVVIVKQIKNENLEQTVEIWSCNCTLTDEKLNNTVRVSKYNNVKCPVVFVGRSNDDVYSQIVACIETVNKDVEK